MTPPSPGPPRPPPLPHQRETAANTRTRMLARVAPRDQTGRVAAMVSCGVLILMFAMFGLLCAGLNVLVPLAMSPFWTLASGIVAIAFGLPHVVIILWLDRNEQEPWWVLLMAFLWGAVMATGLSMVGNTVFGLLATGLVGDPMIGQALTASLSAPPVEELTKGAAVAAIYLFFRRDLDNVLDGLIYGALVGMGFAMMENFVYYTSPFLEGSETAVTDWFQLVFLRGIVTGVGTHWCFTSLTGAGFGLMRVWRVGCVRYTFPVIGLILAMFAHFAWNTFAGLFVIDPDDTWLTLLVSIPIAVVFLQLPFVLLVGSIVIFVWTHEAALIRRYLGEERKSVVMPGEIDRLVPARKRFFRGLYLLFTAQFTAWWHNRTRNKLLIQLAFERWHMDKEEELGAEEEAGEHARRVVDLRKRLRELGPVAV